MFFCDTYRYKEYTMKKYTEKQLISFGNYLLSKERADLFRPIKNFLSKKERMEVVHHSDVENWKDEDFKKFVSNSGEPIVQINESPSTGGSVHRDVTVFITAIARLKEEYDKQNNI